MTQEIDVVGKCISLVIYEILSETNVDIGGVRNPDRINEGVNSVVGQKICADVVGICL